ncbi:hypothetical protein OG352_12675 [Streptomyces sp. NBC_01485]|uniref:hypothetical protein n=1 Tax=Streptomyces sp. NBC_01485 TaxID=2903884 RepID=UPI002E2FADA2|nr:hypothetical protein [Streptomyces sp. NBC_01485]
MNQCTAVALLLPPDCVTQLATPERPAEPGHVLCELGEAHDDDHASVLWEEDRKGGAVWVRWGERRARITELAWCPEQQAGTGDACGLFTGHPSGHARDVVDPTQEAILALLAQEHPELFPDPREPG